MKTKLYALALALISLSAGNAQFAASGSGSSVAAAEINGKINHQEGSGAPGASSSAYACTLGKDLYTDTGTGNLYKCSTTGVSGAAGWTQIGATGTTGAAGAGYTATSTSSLATAGSGSKTFTTQSGLAYTVGARIRATSAGTAEYMEGVVTSYSGTSLIATMDRNSGTSTHADWNINLAGDVGSSGAGSGTVNSGSNPQIAQYVGAGSTTIGGVTVSGDATMANGGALTVTKISGTTPGGACTNQFARSISSSAVPTCASIAAADLPVVGITNGGTGTGSTLTGIVRGSGSAMTAAELSGDATTSGSNAVVLATKHKTRESCWDFGADNAASDLADADIGPQGRIFRIPVTATIIEIGVAANAGTPNVIVQKNVAGTATDLTSATLATAASGGIACSKTTAVTGEDGATTCSATLQNNTAIPAGSWIQTKTGSSFASTGAKRLSVCVTYTVD